MSMASPHEFVEQLRKILPSLPKYLIEMDIRVRAQEPVEVKCVYHPEGGEQSEPITRTFKVQTD